jgi:hypothetical protein
VSEEEEVVRVAKKLVEEDDLTYGWLRGVGDDYETPIPTCVGCNSSSWGHINHSKDCNVKELIDAVNAVTKKDDTKKKFFSKN